MNIFRISLLIIMATLIQACATTEREVPTDHLDVAPNIFRHSGVVFNIREVKKDASLKKQFGTAFAYSLAGGLVGGRIGDGSTGDVMGTVGAFIGQDIANEKYGEIVDRLILKDSNGVEYSCLVHGHDFKVGEKVIFTVVENHVTAIIHATEEQ